MASLLSALRLSVSLAAGLALVPGCGSRTELQSGSNDDAGITLAGDTPDATSPLGNGRGGAPGSEDAGTATGGGDAAPTGDEDAGTTLDAGGATADGAVDAGEVLAIFTTCAEGQSGPDGNVFLNGGGFDPNVSLTLTQTGSLVTATYVDTNGNLRAFEFTGEGTPVPANLASAGQTAASFSGMCVQGPGDFGFYPATLTAETGTLTYQSGSAFFSVEGTIAGDLGPCGAQSASVGYWVACEGGPVAPAATPPAAAPVFPVGTYSCSASTVDMQDHTDGYTTYALFGGQPGTLTLTQAGDVVTAAYSGDSALAGTLTFAVTTATSAVSLAAPAEESLATPCDVPIPSADAALPPSQSFPVSGATLAMNGSSLFLTFTGAMGASTECPGAQVAGGVVCTKE